MSELPKSWTDTSVLSLCDTVRGVSFRKEQASTSPVAGWVSVLRANNIVDDRIEPNELIWVDPEQVSENQMLRVNDVVIAMSSGSSKVVGKTAQHHGKFTGSFGAFCGVLRPRKEIDPKYFGYFFRSRAYRNEISALAAGTNINNIKREHFETITVPLAPLNEQKRIVAKLDELLPKVEACKERLQKIPAILKRFRQSVLAAAVSGRLTEEWRRNNQDIETGEALINRVLKVRSGLTRKVRKSSLDELGVVSNSEEFDLPKGWTVVHPETLLSPTPYSLGIGPFGSNLKVSDYTSSGVPLVFVRHIRANNFDGLDSKFVTQKKANELEAHSVAPLDLVITKMGEPPGDCEIYPSDRPKAILTADCLKFRIWQDFFDLSFYKHCINSTIVKDQLGVITKGVAQQKISVERFRTIKLPVPPLEEQREIARIVDVLFARMNQLWNRYARTTRMLDRTEASILALAFSGSLVSQDPSDEPASALLERIRSAAHQNNGKPKAKVGKRRRKSKEDQEIPGSVEETTSKKLVEVLNDCAGIVGS